MKSDAVIMNEAMKALNAALNPVEVEKFLVLINREKVDYVQWRENLWQGETLESLSEKAQRHFQNKKSGHEKKFPCLLG